MGDQAEHHCPAPGPVESGRARRVSPAAGLSIPLGLPTLARGRPSSLPDSRQDDVNLVST